MVDREKVLAGLKSCADSTGALCRTCPYDFVHNENCMGDMAQDALALLKEDVAHELTKEEWEHWKKDKRRDPICMIYKQDDTRTPIWVLDPNKVHEPALLMGEIKLFTGKPTSEQCKAVKWE